MRVIAGRWRGMRLEAPDGRDTRPTSDRVREAVFSSVFSIVGALEGMDVVDLYAGSGALGIEALSRGASSCTFVESDPRAARTIRRNLSALGDEAVRATTVFAGRVETFADRGPVPDGVSLLLADPPYRIDPSGFSQVLEALAERGALSSGALVVFEHAARVPITWPAAFVPSGEKRYGDTSVSFAVYEGSGA